MLGIPTVAEARAWLGVSVTAVSDDDVQEIIDAELVLQARILDVPADPGDDGNEATYPVPLARALLRRVGRQIAARSVPLGFVGGEASEFSPIALAAYDAEISRLEASYVIPVVS